KCNGGGLDRPTVHQAREPGPLGAVLARISDDSHGAGNEQPPYGWRGPGVNGPRALIPAARYAPGMARTGMISTDSPGKIAKCGWFSNSSAAAPCESARTTV